MAEPVTSVLQHDERLPYLDLVWTPAAMTAFLNESVAPTLFGVTVTGVEVKNLTYRPARQCIALYELSFGDATEYAVITFVKDERLAEAYERHYASDTETRAVYLPEQRCLIERFPNDWELPSLAPAADATVARALMHEVGVESLPEGPWARDVLAYRPHEAAVLQYTAVKGSRLIAKALASAKKAAQVEAVAASLRGQLDASVLTTPPIWRAQSEPRIVFMAHAPGVSLHEALAEATSDDARHKVIERTARALVALHAAHVEVDLPATRTVRQGLDHARDRAVRLHFAAPVLARRAEALLDRLATLLPASEGIQTFLHGDFKGTQLLLHGDTNAVIDLDSACRGEPAVDVGNMMADLAREAALSGPNVSRSTAGAFLESYVALSGRVEVVRPARLFQAIALVRMAVHAFRQQAHRYAGPGPYAPETLLEEAEACLAAL